MPQARLNLKGPMSTRDKLRLEITHTAGPVMFADLLLGDSKAGSVQFRIGNTSRRVFRRLRKLGVEIRVPEYADKTILEKS